jgi:hypothetical protein
VAHTYIFANELLTQANVLTGFPRFFNISYSVDGGGLVAKGLAMDSAVIGSPISSEAITGLLV